MVNYDDRVAQIKTVEDIDTQIRRAKAYVKLMRTKSKNPQYSLAQKLAAQEVTKQAEAVLRKLRMNSFDLEDQVRGKQP